MLGDNHVAVDAPISQRAMQKATGSALPWACKTNARKTRDRVRQRSHTEVREEREVHAEQATIRHCLFWFQRSISCEVEQITIK